MAKTKAQKIEAVVEVADKIKSSKSVVFADYQGLTMSQLTDLRDKLREQKAEFSVTKNSVLERALKETGLPSDVPEIISGPTATLFSYEDEISPLKILVKALKDAQKGPSTSLRIKAGFLNDELLDSLSINRLASLPTKDELRAKVVGSLGSPLYGIVGVLQANLKNLVYALDQIRQTKSV